MTTLSSPAPDVRTSTEVAFEPDWAGITGVYGGRVIAAVAEEARAHAATDGLELASVFVEFTGGAQVGPATLGTGVVHRGRSTATLDVVCTQVQGRPGHEAEPMVERRVVGAVAKFVAPGAALPAVAAPLRAPDPESLPEFVPPWGSLAYDHKFDVRVISHELEEGVPTTRAWVKLQPGTGLGNHGSLAALLDVLPPGLFMREPRPRFVPTVDFAMHLDADVPVVEGEWFHGVMRTEWEAEEFCLESATLQRADGRFVGRGTQTRRIVR